MPARPFAVAASRASLHRLTPLSCAPHLFQEDDEFEEFEQQEWTTAAEDVQDPDMWQDGWEDDEDAAPLVALFRAELAKTQPAQ